MITKKQFEKLAKIKLIEQGGKLVYNGNLDLSFRKDITELPDNLKVLGYLYLYNSGITKLPKGLEVKCFFNISKTEIEELPEDTKFGGSLYVNNMKRPFSFPKVVMVNDSFECFNTTIKRMPKEVYTYWNCYFSESTFDKLPEVMEIGYGLDLYKTNITELPEGLKVIYSELKLCDTKVTKLSNDLVVYSHLNLSNTQIEKLSKGLIVGCGLNLVNTNLKDYSNLHKVCSMFSISEDRYEEIKDTLAKHSKRSFRGDAYVTFEPNYKGAYLFENENGKYICSDNIFAKIIEKKGNVYHIKIGRSKDIAYLVTDGEGNWSHGRTLKAAKADLIYKTTNRDESDYENLTLNSELSFKEAIVCYRVITGACSFGTKNFVEYRLGNNKKDSYTIKEIINLTEGEYGNEVFTEFFCRG